MIGRSATLETLPDIDDPFDAGFDADDQFASTPDMPDGHRIAEGAGPDPYEGERVETFDGGAIGDVYETAATPNQGSPNPVAALIASAEAALGETSVPRITIHFFCQKMETAKLAEYAAADRRLSRATTEVRPGGLVEALEYYRNQPTPSLIVVESGDPGQMLLTNLDKLAEVCDAGTKVLLIGAHNDITLYRELMRRGVSEYLVPPLQPLQLIRSITSLYADPTTPFVGRTLAFIGAKGGCGSSTLAHNLAYQLAEATQSNTVIVDYDLAFGTAGLDFNQDPFQGISDALSKPDRLDHLSVRNLALDRVEEADELLVPMPLHVADLARAVQRFGLPALSLPCHT